MSRNGFLERGLLRPQMLIVLAMIAAAVVSLRIGGEPKSAFAATSAILTPDGQGEYINWTGDESDIDETGSVSCGTTDGDENVSEFTAGDRESVNIDLATIPNGSVVTSATIHVWDSDDTNSNGSNGTYQTFVRIDGSNTDSGSDLVASSSTCTEKTQTINFADFPKTSTTDFEIGVVKDTSDDSSVWVGAIRVEVNYTPPASNPSLPNTCGADVVLIMDSSESVDSSDMTAMKTALINFATSLLGSTSGNSNIGVVEFDNGAATRQALTNDLSSVTAGINAASTSSQVPGGPASGGSSEWTNWQAALTQAQTAFSAGDASKGNIAILISDGDPTQSSSGTPTATQPNVHYAPALTQANTMKGAGTFLITLGVNPSAGGSERLAGISYPDAPLTAATFSALDEALATVFTSQCTGHLTLNKVVSVGDANPNTWTLVAEGPGDSGLSGTTGVNGDVPAGDYALSETGGPSGYVLVKWDCTRTPFEGPPIPVAVEGDSISIEAGWNVTCTATNEQTLGVLKLQKYVINDSGGTADPRDWTLAAAGGPGGGYDYITDPEDADFDDQFNRAEYDFLVAPGTYDLDEDGGPANYIASGWQCQQEFKQPPQSEAVAAIVASDSVTVGAGERWMCWITNDDVTQGSITIAKAATDGADWHVHFPFSDDIPTCDIGNVEVRGSRTCASVQPGTYVISEKTSGGWRLDHISCSGTALVVEDEDSASVRIEIDGNESARCTFYNDPPAPVFFATPEPPTPTPTTVPTAQVGGAQATPTPQAVVESIRPPATGSGGLRDGGHGRVYALLAALIGLGGVAFVLHRRDKQA